MWQRSMERDVCPMDEGAGQMVRATQETIATCGGTSSIDAALLSGFGASCPAQAQLVDLARELEELVANVRNGMEVSSANGRDAGGELHRSASLDELALGLARRLYRDRRRRAEVFNADLFSEPAWDMLLDLYIAGAEDRQVSTTSACIGANVPVATGLRWIQLLENEGLITRKADPRDARRTWISLTANARRSMRRYFAGSVDSAAAAPPTHGALAA